MKFVAEWFASISEWIEDGLGVVLERNGDRLDQFYFHGIFMRLFSIIA